MGTRNREQRRSDTNGGDSSTAVEQAVRKAERLGFEVWHDDKGRTCVGNECFYVMPDEQSGKIKVRIKRGATCPIELKEAARALKRLAEAEVETIYRIDPDDEEDW